jgi:hypothetical protein
MPTDADMYNTLIELEAAKVSGLFAEAATTSQESIKNKSLFKSDDTQLTDSSLTSSKQGKRLLYCKAQFVR